MQSSTSIKPSRHQHLCICHYPVCGTRADTGCRWCAHALHCTALDFSPCHRAAVSSAVHRLAGFKIALPPLTGLHYPVCGTGLQVCSTLCFTNMQPNFKMALHYPVRYREQSAHDDCSRYSLTTGNTGLQVCSRRRPRTHCTHLCLQTPANCCCTKMQPLFWIADFTKMQLIFRIANFTKMQRPLRIANFTKMQLIFRI